MMRVVRAWVCLAALAASGCAELQQVVASEEIDFELSGRIAVRYREEAASGNVAWRHGRDSDEMLLTTPIGSSLARVVRNGNDVVLTTANGDEHRAGDAEGLTEKVLGFRVPIAGLADWVRGRLVSGQPGKAVQDAQGRIASLEQSGWSIEYQGFRPDGLPSRLKLTYPGIELRLAIHQWKDGSRLGNGVESVAR